MEHENPFQDADGEWSDEEQLIPKARPKSQTVRINHPAPGRPASLAAEEGWVQQSSSGENSPVPRPASRGASPLLPPKSPSRPDIKAGSSQEDLVERFYQVTRERDALRKELQRRSTGAYSGIQRASVIYKSDEKTLIEELRQLRNEIRNWTEEYFGGPASNRKKRPHVHSSREMFESLTDNYTAYLKHATDRPLLIQAYLWNKMQQRIFSNLVSGCGYFWAGKLGDRKLRPINDTLRKGAIPIHFQFQSSFFSPSININLILTIRL